MADIFGKLVLGVNKRKYAKVTKGFGNDFNFHDFSLLGTVHFVMRDTNPTYVDMIIEEWAKVLNIVYHTEGVDLMPNRELLQCEDATVKAKVQTEIDAYNDWCGEPQTLEETVEFFDRRVKHYVANHTRYDVEGDDNMKWVCKECLDLYRVLLSRGC